MADQLVVNTAKGDRVGVDLSVGMYQEAADRGQSLKQYLANLYPTKAADGTAYEQLLEQVGMFVRGNAQYGIKAASMHDVLNPHKDASVITKDGVPASRILFPAVILDVIEDKLKVDRTNAAQGLAGMVAVQDNINGDRYERPVLNFSRPEAARSAPTAQLALPNVMLSITASDKNMRIPSWAIGLEASEQALKVATLDFVGLAMARQAEVEASERAYGYILSFLNGDSDYGMAALSSISGKVVTAQSLDSGVATAGTLSQKAWINWLVRNITKRKIDYVITDLAGAMAIENRTGKPVITGDNPNSPRIDTLMTVANPLWANQVKVFITLDPNWPANTIMGIDSRYAIHQVNSLTAAYSAIEAFALKRSTALRVDRGELFYRLFDEAFEVLTLTTS